MLTVVFWKYRPVQMKWLPPGINQPENMTKVALLVLIVLFAVNCECILRPQESETREIKPLDGIWNFRLEDYPNQGIKFDSKFSAEF